MYMTITRRRPTDNAISAILIPDYGRLFEKYKHLFLCKVNLGTIKKKLGTQMKHSS